MSRLGRSSTALDLVKNIDLSGKVAIVTGATSGIGAETARALAAAGAEVILPARQIEYGSAVADKLIADTGNTKIRNYEMDLADFDSVRRFAINFLDEYPRLDILVNNAGIMAIPLQRCPQGFELHFAVNHLGHFLLSATLATALVESPACRVVTLSAAAHRLSPVNFDDINFEHRPYDKWLAYGQSKTANALFALGLHERLVEHSGASIAVNPGSAMTNLQKHLQRQEMVDLAWMDNKGNVQKTFHPIAQAAATSVWAATSADPVEVGGAYCEDCAVAAPAGESDEECGVHPHARDAQAAARLWELSEHWVDCQFIASKPRPRAAPGVMAGTGLV